MVNMPKACSTTGELSNPESKSKSALIYGDAALACELGAGLSTIRTWRAKKLIPYIKTGHKSICYNLAKVLAALESLTVQGGRK